nr:hypothetical protein [Cytophagales bacterium]
MKTNIISLVFLFLFCSFSVFGQDLIITNFKEELKAKVIEIDEVIVKYKKFDFQEGPIYSIKKTDIFLIIYSNGTRETFGQKEIEINSDSQSPGGKQYSKMEDVNLNTSVSSSKSNSNLNLGNPDITSRPKSNSHIFNDGEKFLAIGIGTGASLGNSSPLIPEINVPYISARFDKVYFQFGDKMALGAGIYAAYHHYSIGTFGSESDFNVVLGGLSGSYYYNFSEKLAMGAGARMLYVTIATSSSVGSTIGPVSNVDLIVYGSAFYKFTKKFNLFFELSSGISKANLGIQFRP